MLEMQTIKDAEKFIADESNIGKKIELVYDSDAIFNHLYTIAGTVEGRLVLRYYRKTKQRWIYEVETPYWLFINRAFLTVRD